MILKSLTISVEIDGTTSSRAANVISYRHGNVETIDDGN